MFNHRKIEKKWQLNWENNNTFFTDLDTKKKKYFALDMFPYPSGQGLHVGHPEGYTATDIIARMKKMQGFEVLHPMGWDAFGLPAEQYAIQTLNSPAEFTKKNIGNFKRQLKSLGFSFDWSKEINTTDSKYYKTTQWIFAQLYKNGYAELKNVEVNWSPSLNTVLSNEEVLEDSNGNLVSERDESLVIKKEMKQWVLKITKYADKLFEGLDNLNWPSSVQKLQKKWIYKIDENGKFTSELHLKDWLFSRQRYWGEPFPIVHLDNNKIYLIPEDKYPVLLPKIKDYTFSQDGKPALSKAMDWVNYKDGNIIGKRDLNTMPQWAGSCWYYIAYILKDGNDFLDIESEKAKKRLKKWLPVDLYIGGQEHSVLHLLYARFWNIFLFEKGYIETKEPFLKLYNQGMILGSNGQKMSKSKGNTINPDEIIEEYGADSLRIYEMFLGALSDDKPWNDEGIKSSRKWLERVYRLFLENIEIKDNISSKTKREYNNFLENVTKNYETLKFNLSISDMMIFINYVYKTKEISKNMIIGFLQVLSCVAPHIAEEIYEKLFNSAKSISQKEWPTLIPVTPEQEILRIVIQINGRTRGIIENPKLSISPTEAELENLVKKNFSKYFNNSKIKNIIYVKNKLINVVI